MSYADFDMYSLGPELLCEDDVHNCAKNKRRHCFEGDTSVVDERQYSWASVVVVAAIATDVRCLSLDVVTNDSSRLILYDCFGLWLLTSKMHEQNKQRLVLEV